MTVRSFWSGSQCLLGELAIILLQINPWRIAIATAFAWLWHLRVNKMRWM
jgi:hypothetical protein